MTISRSTVVKRCEMPAVSVLKNSLIDYYDSYSTSLHDNNDSANVTSFAKAFFTSAPRWVESLLHIRNKAVALFGLKASGDLEELKKQLLHFSCEPGEQVGLFKVFSKSDHEIILGEDDKHLDFRLSIFLQPAELKDVKTLTVTTAVNFNNRFGRLYFFVIKPFHKMIMPVLMKGMIVQVLDQGRTVTAFPEHSAQ